MTQLVRKYQHSGALGYRQLTSKYGPYFSWPKLPTSGFYEQDTLDKAEEAKRKWTIHQNILNGKEPIGTIFTPGLYSRDEARKIYQGYLRHRGNWNSHYYNVPLFDKVRKQSNSDTIGSQYQPKVWYHQITRPRGWSLATPDDMKEFDVQWNKQVGK